ncbi:glycosyltransferase family 4 protein [Candidatus Viridilinea mediisalina]|uniref:Glycosyl transferase family 1 n=1 Tax=Candidatus Viridilinea mediisalina TaxID=2024553 RepID=A0A2A6RDI8_9CHLR|nr:glycosyltransferase family 4 protein [Candidatus Viridilinea mediisalina]PDW00533.1 glycosyl transferase family 1 [Candidatus Viridilinea mediisalina]
MHFLHINQLYNPASGASRYFHELGARLVAEGHRVTLLSSNALDLEYFWDARRRHVDAGEAWLEGVRMLRLPVQRLPGPPIVYPILRRLMVELSRLGPRTVPLLQAMATLTPRMVALEDILASLSDIDLVHSTNITLDFALLPVAHWAQQRDIPHLCTPFIHLGEPNSRQIVQYYSMPHQIALLRKCSAVATMTELERSFLIQLGLQAERVHVVGAGVDPSEVGGGDGNVFRAHYKINGPIVLSLGAAAYDKGSIHVLEALRRLWATGETVTWVQCGPLLGHFEQHYAQLSPSEQAHTRVLGYVDDQTRRDALAAATIYAQPSRTDSFGIAYLEAWCYGLSVIGAHAGGVPAVIRDGQDGLLIPFGDISALSEALRRLLHNPALAQTLGSNGHQRVLRELTWDAAYGRIRRLYLGG